MDRLFTITVPIHRRIGIGIQILVQGRGDADVPFPGVLGQEAAGVGVVEARFGVDESGFGIFFVAGEADAVPGGAGVEAFMAPGVVLVSCSDVTAEGSQVDRTAEGIEDVVFAVPAAFGEAEQAEGTVAVVGQEVAAGVTLQQQAVSVVGVAFDAALALFFHPQAAVVIDEASDLGATDGDLTQLVAGVIGELGHLTALDLLDLVAVGVVAVGDAVGRIQTVGDGSQFIAVVVVVDPVPDELIVGDPRGALGQAVEIGVVGVGDLGVVSFAERIPALW